MDANQEHNTLNILLADDDMDDRYFFARALEEISLPTQLVTVNNGKNLMEYLNEHAQNLPDVLFLDLSMNLMTGFECLAEIKENERLKALPVVMYSTSFTHTPDFEYNLKNTLNKMGAHDFIRKPDNLETLKQTIQNSLKKVLPELE